MLLIGDGESPKRLAPMLGAEYVLPRKERPRFFFRPETPIVCWGWTPLSVPWLRHEVLNKVLNRRIVFNKVVQLERMQNAGIPTPAIYKAHHDVDNALYIGRRFSHYAGVDVRGPFSASRMREEILEGRSDFGVQLIEKTREFRVHSFKGKSIHMCEKIPDSPENRASIVWGNNQCSWVFIRDRDEAWRKNLGRLANTAVACLGMDFGAVDVIEDKEENLYALEVNSAPWLYKNTLRAYQEAIQAWAAS